MLRKIIKSRNTISCYIVSNYIFYCISLLQTNSPSGPILSPLGWYLLISLLFVFGAISEFAIALILHRKEKSATSTSSNESTKANENVECFQLTKQIANERTNSKRIRPADKTTKLEPYEGVARTGIFGINLHAMESMPFSTQIDVLAFVTYNLMYLIFNFIYWPRV